MKMNIPKIHKLTQNISAGAKRLGRAGGHF